MPTLEDLAQTMRAEVNAMVDSRIREIFALAEDVSPKTATDSYAAHNAWLDSLFERAKSTVVEQSPDHAFRAILTDSAGHPTGEFRWQVVRVQFHSAPCVDGRFARGYATVTMNAGDHFVTANVWCRVEHLW